MQYKELSRRFRRFLARLGLQFCSLTVTIIPQRFIYAFAHLLANIGYVVVSRHRKTAIESLSIAFGSEKSLQALKKIAFESFDAMAKSGVEFLVFLQKPYLINASVTVEGIEHLEWALAKKNGVIALSAHFGNFPLVENHAAD